MSDETKGEEREIFNDSTEGSPRAGWEDAFARMRQSDDDKLLWPDFPNEWDEEDWD